MDKLFKTVPCILRINLSLAVLLQGIFYLKCLCNIRFETNSNWKAVPLYISGIGTLQMLKQPITLPGMKGVSQWYVPFAKPPAAWRNSQKLCHGFLIFFNLSLTIISNLYSIDNFKRNHLWQDTLFVGCVSDFLQWKATSFVGRTLLFIFGKVKSDTFYKPLSLFLSVFRCFFGPWPRPD